jgi:putative peptide zinc metalloprotease protein
MAAPLFSNWWYRVAERKPKLRSHARLHRHLYRGEVWYLLQDATSSRIHRFTPSARLIIALMDGRHTVEELWEVANKHLGEDAPTQDELIQLLGQLHAADLLESDVTPDVAELFARSEREERARHFRSYANPMAIRIPLWDPDAFLNRLKGLLRLIWGGWGALVWLAVVLPAMFLVWPHWPELSNNFSDRVLAADNLFAIYLVFPVIKALHELGHASATKAGGGEVHDLGIILLVLLPVPYVDASAASVFKSKYRRSVVGAAGIAVELFVAAIAFYIWLLIEPGLLRATLFNVMLIASVSTVLFNGNPLLRYDAYYILADLIEIPNLAGRSTRYWGYLIERYILGVREAETPEASHAEKAWFLFYGFASTLYRILVTILIALFIAGQFFFIGVLLAIWTLGAMAIFPVIKALRHLADNPRLRKHRSRAVAITCGIVLGLGGFLVGVPMPYHSHGEGVLWLPEEAMVRAGANGFLGHFLVQPGTHVAQGDALVQCFDPALNAQLRRSEAKVAELQAEYSTQFVLDRAKAQIARDKLDSEQANLALVRERAAELLVRAKTDGVFIAPQMVDMPGRYYRKGDLLGYVVGKANALARVVVPQEAVDKVRLATDRVRVRSVDHPQLVLQGKVLREVPAGEEYLPSPALGVEGGGEIATDPREANGPKANGPKALQRMFQFDVALSGISHLDYFGQRVFVRFEHQMEPLSVQWYRSIRLLFLTSFHV